MQALAPSQAFRGALDLIRVAPGAMLALGFSLYASLVAVCCGLGVVAAPWFLCELWALYITHGTGLPLSRTRAWIGAGAIQALAVLVTWSVVLVALCVLRPELVTGGVQKLGGDRNALLLQALVAMNVAGALVIGVSVHMQYAPALLIERGGSVAAALLESARIVDEAGALRTFVTSGVGHALQVGVPLVGAALLSTLGSPWAMAVFGALLLPASVASLLVAQGMIAASYLAVRRADYTPSVSEAPATRLGMALWVALLFGTLAGPVAVSFAALKPVMPEAAAPLAPDAAIVELRARPEPSQRFIADTALSVRLDHGVASVLASDGGGAGPIPTDRPVRALRVARVRRPGAPANAEPEFALELALDDGRILRSQIDEAGVRADDSMERRVASRLSALPALCLLGALLWAAAWMAWVLPAEARAQRLPSHAARAYGALWAAARLSPATLASGWVAASVLTR